MQKIYILCYYPHTMIKRLSIIILLALFFSVQSVWAEDVSRKLVKFTKGFSMYSYYDDSIVLLTPRKRGLDASFLINWSSANSLIAQPNTSCAAVNGFYFGKWLEGERFQPAGYVTFYQWLNKQTAYIPSTTNPDDDVNLGVQVFYNTINNNISLNSPFKISHGVSFFAGPMIIDRGEINPNLTKKISHRSTAHYRTFLIQDKNNKAIFGISKTKISLPELATKLSQIVKWNSFSVVNLDGGSSTSIAVSGYNFNSAKNLPSRFTTCK